MSLTKFDINHLMIRVRRIARKKSTCLEDKRKTGCLIFSESEHRIISEGYNGAPTKEFSCCDLNNCIRETRNIESGKDIHITRAIHAEVRAIFIALPKYNKLGQCTLLINRRPCSDCLKLLIYVGIKKIYYEDDYNDDFVDFLLEYYDDVKMEKVEVIE